MSNKGLLCSMLGWWMVHWWKGNYIFFKLRGYILERLEYFILNDWGGCWVKWSRNTWWSRNRLTMRSQNRDNVVKICHNTLQWPLFIRIIDIVNSCWLAVVWRVRKKCPIIGKNTQDSWKENLSLSPNVHWV